MDTSQNTTTSRLGKTGLSAETKPQLIPQTHTEKKFKAGLALGSYPFVVDSHLHPVVKAWWWISGCIIMVYGCCMS
jgi:hypothetical protein